MLESSLAARWDCSRAGNKHQVSIGGELRTTIKAQGVGGCLVFPLGVVRRLLLVTNPLVSSLPSLLPPSDTHLPGSEDSRLPVRPRLVGMLLLPLGRFGRDELSSKKPGISSSDEPRKQGWSERRTFW